MSHLRQFEDENGMYEFLMGAIENQSLTQEALETPDWGVSPMFLIQAIYDAQAASQAKWMKPLMFLTGIATGMIGGALLSLEAPIYWLTF